STGRPPVAHFVLVCGARLIVDIAGRPVGNLNCSRPGAVCTSRKSGRLLPSQTNRTIGRAELRGTIGEHHSEVWSSRVWSSRVWSSNRSIDTSILKLVH